MPNDRTKTIFATRYGHLHLNRNIHLLLVTCKDIFAKNKRNKQNFTLHDVLHFSCFCVCIVYACVRVL